MNERKNNNINNYGETKSIILVYIHSVIIIFKSVFLLFAINEPNSKRKSCVKKQNICYKSCDIPKGKNIYSIIYINKSVGRVYYFDIHTIWFCVNRLFHFNEPRKQYCILNIRPRKYRRRPKYRYIGQSYIMSIFFG